MAFFMLVIGLFVSIPVIATVLMKANKVKGFDREARLLKETMTARLRAVAPEIGGALVDGPALKTDLGRLALGASGMKGPSKIDVAKVTSSFYLPQQLTVVPVEDVAKALRPKRLRPVNLEDSAVGAKYAVLASDEDFARRVATPQVIQLLLEVGGATNARARLQVAPSGATVLVTRGLAKPEELKAFYDKSLAVIKCLRALATA